VNNYSIADDQTGEKLKSVETDSLTVLKTDIHGDDRASSVSAAAGP
jgi:hypothetical protein